MKIAFINGSPKAKHSTSASILTDLKTALSKNLEIIPVELHKAVISEKDMEKLKTCDTLVFAFPLYVDGIPSHLLSCLTALETAPWQDKRGRVYGIVNCGFYEGIQAEPALKVLENWCAKAGFLWSGGIGIGGGGALAQLPDAKNGHGPKAPVSKALGALAGSILQNETQKNHYISIAFPRFLYKLAAQMDWRQMVKQNGGRAKDLGRRRE